jgi:hypothetical protein
MIMLLILDVMFREFHIASINGVVIPYMKMWGMKLFILSFDDDDLDWFTKLKDKQIRTYKELTNAFMEKWKEKEPPIIKTVNSDASLDFDEKFTDVIQAMRFAHEMQLKDMEARLAEAEAFIKYSDPIEPELHSEQENEFHLEILEEPIYESLTDHEVIKDFELEMIEYPDNSNPHPPSRGIHLFR